MTDYILIRSKRRTIALIIRNDKLEVRAPLKMPKSEIDKFVASKEKWIHKHIIHSNEKITKRKNFSIDYGDYITYRGRIYSIVAKEGTCVGFDENNFYMPPDMTPKQIKAVCIQIYRLLAKNYIVERTLAFARRILVVPTSVKISNAKTCWGSCSAKKNVNFSWRLIMAEDELIDYVIVHELAHILEMNHSQKFWAVVESVLPDYRERKSKLKEFQRHLSGEDWES